MRVGFEGWTPHLYFGVSSTGKRIADEVEEGVIRFLKRNVKTGRSVIVDGETYRVSSRKFKIQYDRNELIAIIAEALNKGVNYQGYKSADEGKKSMFADSVASKIVNHIAARSKCRISKDAEVSRGLFSGLSGAAVTHSIAPSLPTVDGVKGMFSETYSFVNRSRLTKIEEGIDKSLDDLFATVGQVAIKVKQTVLKILFP